MHYLIDGHNLIGQTPDIDLKDPDDEMKLVKRLRRWTLADPRRQVTVYFDGGLYHGKSGNLSGSLVTVVFSSRRQTADSVIIRRLKALKNPQEFTLVTSDREIVAQARRRRVPHIKSERFAMQVIQDLTVRDEPEPAKPAPSPKEKPALSEAEVDAWLNEFGPIEMPPAQPYRPRLRQEPEAAPEPPPKPRKADELKESGEELTQDEVAEWLSLFGPPDKATKPADDDKAPPPDKPLPGQRPKPKVYRSKPRPADRMKESGAKLSQDEVAEWLRIFRDDGS